MKRSNSGETTSRLGARIADPERWVGRTLERGQGAAGRAVHEERTVSVPDVLALDLPAWLREIAVAENRRSAVGVPLRARGRLIGIGWSVRAVARAVVPAEGLDALQTPLFAEHDVVSGASVPMVAGDRRVGLMGVYWRSARSVSASERRLVALVANQTSAALTQLPGLGH